MSVPVTTDSLSVKAHAEPRRLVCRDRSLLLDGEPKMVGIVNITDDSFFDGGRFASTEAAVAQSLRLVAEGAAMLDLGGQSTRPGYAEISAEEEIARVVPVISTLLEKTSVPLSIDTYKPAVARAALAAGAHVLNDIHGFLGDETLAEIAAEAGCAVILMHNDEAYKAAHLDPIAAMLAFFDRSLAVAARAGVAREKIMLDPGIGFAKTHEQNLALLARLDELRVLGLPLLLGASRKSVIGNVLSLPPEERLEGTLATTALAVWQGVEFIRVHDVCANARAAKTAAAIRNHSKP
ncbi:MAG: dihydropteroate synthase [Verrucomicrobia bacterium]|nr:dihydropteroate synthase [Verrucomicrobiota bacterium]